MSHDHWRQDARLIRNTIEKSGEVLQWLEDKGLKIPQIRQFAGDDAPLVGHDGGGMGILGDAILRILTADCSKRGIKILCETPANKILTDKQGTVTGILAAAKDKEIRINSKGIILASGGFAHNKELMKKYFPCNVDLSDRFCAANDRRRLLNGGRDGGHCGRSSGYLAGGRS